MFWQVVRLGVLAAWTALLAGCSCSSRPARVDPPAIDASAAGTAAIAQYDQDADGKIGGAELDKAAALKQALEKLDTDSDGAVSAAEITARIEAWQESEIALVDASCTVTLNNKPLEGATVTFVPESFLGEEVKPASGTTDVGGSAILNIEGSDDGMHCGFYRVEITASGTTIPSRYNTESTLGQEIAQDAVGITEGLRFELEPK